MQNARDDRDNNEKPVSWIDCLRFSGHGEDRLVPAIIQDAISLKVLMLGYMNREAIERTLETGKTWFWSRSRRRLWQKGETSGHFQLVREILVDCDSDSLLLKVDQVGGACHEGYDSCFYRRVRGGGGVEIVGQKVFEPGEVYAGSPSAPGSSGAPSALGAPDVAGAPGAQPDASGGDGAGAPAAGRGIIEELCRVIDERRANPSPDSYTARLFQRGHDVILKKIGEEAGEVIIASKNKEIGQIVYETADLLFHTLVMLRFHGIEFDDILRELRRRRKPGPAGQAGERSGELGGGGPGAPEPAR